jgi:hypothetical protein
MGWIRVAMVWADYGLGWAEDRLGRPWVLLAIAWNGPELVLA